MPEQKFDAEFDVIVCGAGSAGCVMSGRLTENPDISLCAIEAGGRDRNPWIHIPMGFGKLVPNPKVNWGYETEPEPGLGGRTVIWPRGKVLGGSGSINGLVFLRGAPSDYDEWARLGLPGRAALFQADGALGRWRQRMARHRRPDDGVEHQAPFDRGQGVRGG